MSKPNLIRAADLESNDVSFSHPWNPNSLVRGVTLSRLAGLERTGVSFVRIPPGKESFVYHSHQFEEEWIYVLSGRGIAEIDGAEHEVGPGDFMGFPTPSVAHHMRNPFDAELVYLMGGENREFEVADYPKLGRRMVRTRDQRMLYDLSSGKPFVYE
jgi:uncharacterized cupin superfamily protein